MDSRDRDIWRFAQKKQIIILTDNRNKKGASSLQQTIEEENTLLSLPVLTIGNVNRLSEKIYRDRCVARLIEILSNIENYKGTGRLFVP